jgi:putative transposase
MANTYSQLFYHIVFSTKNRIDFIHREIEERVRAYIGGTARKHGISALQVGGIENHAHALVMAKPTIAPCNIPMWLKGASSKWIHDELGDLREFGWQDGYGIFSVSKSNVPDAIKYIKDQREHHRQQTFEEELIGPQAAWHRV